jgi:hypothetical protein
MNYAHFKVTTGLAYELCTEYIKKRNTEQLKIDELINKYYAMKGRSLVCGTCLEGLYFGAVTPKGWKKTKQFPGYCIPSKTKLGIEIKKELDTVRMPSAEKLARDLGCKPFFMDFDDGNQYCASIGVFQFGKTFYLESSKWCKPSTAQFPGIIEIPTSEWYKAQENKSKCK